MTDPNATPITTEAPVEETETFTVEPTNPSKKDTLALLAYKTLRVAELPVYQKKGTNRNVQDADNSNIVKIGTTIKTLITAVFGILTVWNVNTSIDPDNLITLVDMIQTFVLFALTLIPTLPAISRTLLGRLTGKYTDHSKGRIPARAENASTAEIYLGGEQYVSAKQAVELTKYWK
jgi:hypothetical protein